MFQFLFVTAFSLLSVLAPQNTGEMLAAYQKYGDVDAHAPTIFDEDIYAWEKNLCNKDVAAAKEELKEYQQEFRLYRQWGLIQKMQKEWRKCSELAKRTMAGTRGFAKLKSRERQYAMLALVEKLGCEKPQTTLPRWEPPICVKSLRYHRAHWDEEPLCDWPCWLGLKKQQWARLYDDSVLYDVAVILQASWVIAASQIATVTKVAKK